MGFAEALQTALWIFDIEERRMLWANTAALELWKADNLEQLIARDFGADMSSAVATRLDNYLSQFRRGETVTESWTFFPNDKPVTAMCRCSGYRLPSDRLVMLVEGTPMDSVEAPTRRALEALRHSSVLASVYDDAGALLFRNPAAEQALGAGGSLAGHFVHGDDWGSIKQALLHDDMCSLEAEVNTAGGVRVHRLDIRRTPDPETGSVMMVVSENDVTDIHRALEAVSESEQTLREITDVLADGVYVLDQQGHITFTNPSAEKLLGWSREALIGRDAHSTFHHSREGGERYPHEECPAIKAINNAQPYRSFKDHFIRRDGTMLPVALAAAPIIRHGKVVASVTAFHDISQQLAAEAKLREKEQSLSNAQRIAHLGNWDWDVRKGGISWSDEVYRIFGLEPSQFEPTYERFLERLHPDDREHVSDAVNAAVRGDGDYRIEHRVIRPDGSERIVYERGEVQFDDNGAPLHMTGTVLDITERKNAELALEETQRRLAALISNLRGAVLVEDEKHRIVLVNQAFCDVFAIPLSPEQLIGLNCAEAAAQSSRLFAELERFVRRIGNILEN